MENQESQWINIADVMSALMMIFMFISIAFLYQILNEKETYRLQLNKALHKEFDKDLDTWKAIITDDNIIRFNSPFAVGDDTIPENFRIILEDFFPRYIEVLSLDKFKQEIDEIRVEGHTSDDWGDANQRDSYIYNMNLSQKRASNVLEFCYNIQDEVVDQNILWLQSNLRANGMSFSKLLYKDEEKTIQDKARSRRVEFRVVTKEHKNKI
jgi:outer membrane protein OmpA-like peptidoglycan-associated protein